MKIRLIDDWRRSWRFGSVWLAWAAAALSGSIIAAAPGLVVQALTAPLATRIVIAAMVALAVAASAWSTRILAVQKKDKSDG